MIIYNVLVEDRKHMEFGVESFSTKGKAWDYIRNEAKQHHGYDVDTKDVDDGNIDKVDGNHLYISDREIYYEVRKATLQ